MNKDFYFPISVFNAYNLRAFFRFLRTAIFLFSTLLVFFLTMPLLADDPRVIPVPDLKARVIDQVGLLKPQTRNRLIQELEDLEKNNSSQLVVLILPTTGWDGIEEYSMRVVDEWKLGQKGTDNGVLLLIAVNDRKARIEVGYGLEGAIPDIIAKRILDRHLTPAFRAKNFDKGVVDTVGLLTEIIKTEEIPKHLAEEPTFRGLGGTDQIVLSMIIILTGLVFMVVGVWMSFHSSPKSGFIILALSLLVAIFIGFFGSSFVPSMSFGLLVAGIIAFFLGLRNVLKSGGYSHGYRSTRSYRSASWGSSTGGYGSGSWGGGGFGGGSGGGFGGGGGSFGGGGATGGW